MKTERVKPWKATTLEWTAPIDAGHGNWNGPIPTVHRWAYDYSKFDEEEFTLQHIPVREFEKRKNIKIIVDDIVVVKT